MDERALRERWEQVAGPATGWEGLSTLQTFRPSEHATVPLIDAGAALPPVGARFEPGEEIGRGGMGVVVRARQTALERDVALKRLRDDRSGPDARAQFIVEARLHGRLEHPNILPVHSLDADRGRPLLAMKLVGGETWEELLRREPDALGRHLEILLAVCNAVAYAHSRGVLHADLKPANVMLGAFGEVQLVDWGVALELADDARLRPRSAVQSGFGTPAFMPPELALGDAAAIGPATDTYLLGGLLYRILAGRPPRQGASFLQVLARASVGALDPLPVDAPEALAALCRRALAAEPGARFADVASFAAALRGYLTERESHRLAALAGRHLDAAGSRAGPEADEERRNELYRGFSASVAGFEQALELWAGNGAARDGLTRARRAWARAALELGDHALCASLLAELPEASAATLRPELERARQQRARAARTRRRQRVALALSGALLIGGLLGILLLREQQRRALEVQKLAAEQRAVIASDFLRDISSFAHEELVGTDRRGRETGRELLERTAASWRALGEALRDEDPGGWARASTLLQLATVQSQLEGESERARRTLAEALTSLERWHAADPSHLQVRAELVEALVLRAVQHQERAALDAAERDLVRARGLCDGLPPRAEARVLGQLRELAWEAGRRSEAWELGAAQLALVRQRAADGDSAGLARALHRHAEVALRTGSFEAAEPLIREALAVLAPRLAAGALHVRIEHARARAVLAEVERARGALASALARRRTGVAFWRELLGADPGNFQWKRLLAEELGGQAALERATGSLQSAAESYVQLRAVGLELVAADSLRIGPLLQLARSERGLAGVRLDQGRFDEARALLSAAAARLAPRDEDATVRLRIEVLLELANAYQQAGALAACEEPLADALRLVEGIDKESVYDAHQQCAAELQQISWLLACGRGGEAREWIARNLERSRALLERFPAHPRALQQLAFILELQAVVAHADGDLAGAAAAAAQARLLHEEVLATDPAQADVRCAVADALYREAELAAAQGRPDVAHQALEASRDHWQRLLTADSTQLLAHRGLLLGELLAAELELERGRPDEVRARLSAVESGALALRAERPDSLSAHRLLWLAASVRGRLRLAEGDGAGATDAFVRALEHNQAAGEAPRALYARASLLDQLANARLQAGAPLEAFACHQQRAGILRDLLAADPTSLALRRTLAATHTALGRFHQALGAKEDARRAHAEALALRRETAGPAELQDALRALALVSLPADGVALLEEHVAIGQQRAAEGEPGARSLMHGSYALAEILRGAGRPAEAAQAWARTAAALTALPPDPALVEARSACLFYRGELLCAAGDPAAAIPVYDELIAVDEAGLFRGHRARALARARANDLDGARDDLQTALASAPEPYAALWLVGFGGPAEALDPFPADATWPGPLVAFMRGDRDLDSVADAIRGTPREELARRCELLSFAGLCAERDGDRERAATLYRVALDLEQRALVEWQWARDRLAAWE